MAGDENPEFMSEEELDLWASRLTRDRAAGDGGSLESDHMEMHTGRVNVQVR